MHPSPGKRLDGSEAAVYGWDGEQQDGVLAHPSGRRLGSGRDVEVQGLEHRDPRTEAAEAAMRRLGSLAAPASTSAAQSATATATAAPASLPRSSQAAGSWSVAPEGNSPTEDGCCAHLPHSQQHAAGVDRQSDSTIELSVALHRFLQSAGQADGAGPATQALTTILQVCAVSWCSEHIPCGHEAHMPHADSDSIGDGT